MFKLTSFKYSLICFLCFLIKNVCSFFVVLLCCVTPIKKNKIVFSSFEGAWVGCNPKYILKEIIKQNMKCEIVWLCTKEQMNDEYFDKKVRYVDSKNKISVIKELASAKIWIDNTLKTDLFKIGLIKKNNQIYINTWHGSCGIKKLFYDTDNYSPDKNYADMLKKEFNSCDLMISNCEWEENVFRNAMKYSNEIKRVGHPRNDIFFEDIQKYRDKIVKILNIDKAAKIALYMPTYRNSLADFYYDLDFEILKNTLKQRFGGDWIILIRSHNFNLSKNIFKDKLAFNVSFYPDSQELLASADVLISDYSSCMFDYLLTKKPCFVYAKDVEEYQIERGLYYSFSETPFLVSKNNTELQNNILNFDEEEYKNKCIEFLEKKELFEDGKSSFRVVEIIKNMVNNEI